MRGKLFFGAATAALLMLAPSAMAQTGDPAGDASTTARFSGGAIEGELSSGDTDWYAMRVEQGQMYAFTLDAIPDAEGAAVDPVLTIYDAAGNQLAFNDDYDGLNSALRFAPQASGDVYVEARSFSPELIGRYRLAATATAVPPDDAANDTSTRARINAGRPVDGELGYEGDVDVYRFTTRTGTRYSITLNGSGATPVGDPFLRVLDRDGNELAVNDDFDGLNSGLEFTPDSNGDVFIEARGYADAYTGGYTLSIVSARVQSDGLSSDRNTRGRLNVGSEISGAIDPSNDQDWYRVRLEEGQSYRFTLVSSGDNPLGDPFLALMDSSGEQVAGDDDGGEGLNSYLEFTASETGTYFIAAQSFAAASTGGYTLAVRAGDVPGDASTDATLSVEGDYREGVLSPAGDRDWYAITLSEGQGVRLAVNTIEDADPLTDPYIILYGPDGAEVLRDDDGGDGLNAWSEFQAPAGGVYHLEVRGFTEDASGRYAVTLTPGEIGGGPEGAEYILAGPEGRIATIGAPGDVDWFVVEMIEGRPYRINVDGIEGGLADPLLVLYDSTGAEVARDDDGGLGLNAYLSFVSATGGPYFAAVSAYDGESVGQYAIRINDTDVPGQIYTDEMLDQAGDERLGRIEIEGDLDNYRVDLEGGVTYTIEVRGEGDRPLADPFLAIVDVENNRITSDDDSGPGLDARLRFTPENSGPYFLQASGLGGSTGWYKITIARQ